MALNVIIKILSLYKIRKILNFFYDESKIPKKISFDYRCIEKSNIYQNLKPFL